jgi:hypothetical protein
MAAKLDERKLHGRHRNAYLALYIIGALTLLLGVIAELGRVEVLLQLFGSGWVVAVEGLVLLALGYFTMRGSLVALGIAIALYALDAISSVLLGGIRGIWIRLLVLFFLVQGFIALRELKRRRAAAEMPAAVTPLPDQATS